MTRRPIRLLIIDDSALVRKMMAESLSQFPDIEVVGSAIDPIVAQDKITKFSPDVLTLDIEMPRMDGLTFLKYLMKNRPIPVIIISSLTTTGSAKVLEALQAGAVDVLAKPNGSFSAYDNATKLVEKIKIAAQAKLKIPRFIDAPTTSDIPIKPQIIDSKISTISKPVGSSAPLAAPPRLAVQKYFPSPTQKPVSKNRAYAPRDLILLGASTGGTEALKEVLTHLSPDIPGICIVQHIPAVFSLAFANRLNELCAFEVREAKSGDMIKPGLALVAPGGFHMIVRWAVTHYTVELNTGPPVHHQRPAVDILFDSAVKAGVGNRCIAALLTGMGADGANGLLKLKQAGATTIAQDEDSCVVFGMPKEAIRMGAAQHILSLNQIAGRIERFASDIAAQRR